MNYIDVGKYLYRQSLKKLSNFAYYSMRIIFQVIFAIYIISSSKITAIILKQYFVPFLKYLVNVKFTKYK